MIDKYKLHFNELDTKEMGFVKIGDCVGHSLFGVGEIEFIAQDDEQKYIIGVKFLDGKSRSFLLTDFHLNAIASSK